jgi:hypothetical protein
VPAGREPDEFYAILGTMLSPSVQLPGVLRPVVFRARLAKP